MILFALAAALAAAPERVDGWAITSDAERCTATRTFGGRSPVTIRVNSRTTSDYAGNIWILMPQGSPDWIGKSFVLKSSSGARFIWPYAYMSQPPEGGVSLSGSLDVRDWAALVGTSSLKVQIADIAPLTIATGPMAPAMTALKKCGDAILRGWGVDPDRMVGLSVVPTSLFWNADYPIDARLAKQQGRVVVIVGVGPSGEPGTCKVVVSSGSASLDSRTCELVLERARYPKGTGQRWGITSTRWALSR